jgi:ectoine hydroxylase-related dioxygenase (phytanoyl-CoA dioxygenase family)
MLGQVADDAQLAALQERIDALMLGQVPNEHIWFQLDSETGEYGDLKFGSGKWEVATKNYRKIEKLERDPVFLAYIQHPLFRDITRQLIGENVSIYRAMFMNKPARRGTYLPYHQDAGTQWSLDRDPYVTIWTALDDSTIANGCVQIIPGSHRLGLLSERGHTITPEQEAIYCREEDSRYLEMKAGEVVLLHNLVLHRSGINATEQPRRAFSVVYMDAATRDISGRGIVYPVVFGQPVL